MPTYVLEGGTSVRLPAKPLTLRVQAPGSAVSLVALRDGQPDHSAITPMPGMLVLPRIAEPVEVQLVPASGQSFASGTVVSLSAGIELHGDPDPEQAVMSGLDLSGLPRRALLSIERQGSELVVTALGVTVDAPLPPLAARSRDLAREVLGAERVPAARARSLQVTVDASASMQPMAGDGSVAAAVEVLLGVSRVTSSDKEFAVDLADTSSVEVRGPSGTPVELAELPRAVHDQLAGHGMRTGFRATGAYSSDQGLGEDWVRCLVTDQLPAQLPSGDAQQPVLVVLATSSAAQVMRARARGPVAWVPVDEQGHSAYEALMNDQRALQQVVQAVLAGILAEGGADDSLGAR